MKKLKAVITLCAVMVLLSGCSAKTEYNMSIAEDKSMDFSIIMAMDEELIDGMLSMQNQTGEQTEYTEEQVWALLEDSIESDDSPSDYGFTEERYQEGEYFGFKYTKKISNIDDISGNTANFKLEEFQNISDSIVFVKNGDKYKANFVLSSEEQSESTQGYNIGIEMNFVVTLPNKPISHNATEVSEDGKTLTWNLLDEDSKNIEFEFSFGNNMLLYISIAAGAILLVGIIVVVVVSKSRKNNKDNNNENKIVQNETMVENESEFIEQPVMTQASPMQPVEQPQVAPTQPVEQPQVVPTQPVEQPQVAPTQPVQQPQVASAQPELPSVADILGLPEQNQNNNN